MFAKFTVLVAVFSAVSCQINGEFWWLNNNVRKLKPISVAAPKFDDVNELDTDETARIVFKDDEEADTSKTDLEKYPKLEKIVNVSVNAIHFRDETALAKTFNKFVYINFNNKLWDDSKNSHKEKTSNENADKFRFVFPNYDDESLGWTSSENVSKKAEKTTSYIKTDPINKKHAADNMMSHNAIHTSLDKNQLHPENICTFIKKSECILNNGILYSPAKSKILETISNEQILCCILPISTTPISKIVFPETKWRTQRLKRSNLEDINPSLKQRNVLMSRKYASNNQRIWTTSSPRKKITQKVVSSDEYNSDPYWNIKNSNIRNPDTPMYQDPDSAYDDGSQSYGDDYTVELPRPGLVGLYSDHRQTSWTHNKNKGFAYDAPDSIEEEFEAPLGYSNIDPRLDHRSSSEAPKLHRRRPSKLTATFSRDPMGNSQSEIINFHANPDFQVLQGFKLLNLGRNKNRFVRRTPEPAIDCESHGSKTKSKPQKLTMHSDENFEDNIFETKIKENLFNECRKTVKVSDCQKGKEQGLVEFGEHPWITLVVLTKNQEHVLCYATLVYSRVAISAADCVYGQSPGAVSIIAGVQNLDKDLAHSQHRMVSIFLDSNYTKGNFGLNLALLHWKLPLILDAKVQPTCLSDLPAGDDCVLVGWGGYDQEMRSELRWQRASILAPQNCNKRLSKLEVNDALCAAVESRGTVSGVGGPLLCKTAERWSTVGVAVWRDEVIILLPPRDWVIKNMANLQII